MTTERFAGTGNTEQALIADNIWSNQIACGIWQLQLINFDIGNGKSCLADGSNVTHLTLIVLYVSFPQNPAPTLETLSDSWFPPGTPVSPTNESDVSSSPPPRYDPIAVAEALSHNKPKPKQEHTVSF